MATAKLDDTAKRQVVEALLGASTPLDTGRIGRLEQELRTLELDNAFGRVGDEDYLRRKAGLTNEVDEARRPAPDMGTIDPVRALAGSTTCARSRGGAAGARGDAPGV